MTPAEEEGLQGRTPTLTEHWYQVTRWQCFYLGEKKCYYWFSLGNTKLVNWSKVLQILVSEPGYLHSLSNFLEFREKTKSKMYGGVEYRLYWSRIAPGLTPHFLLSFLKALAMELAEVREKALSCQSVLRYLEPRTEMRLLWRSALDIGTGYFETISNTIRWLKYFMSSWRFKLQTVSNCMLSRQFL